MRGGTGGEVDGMEFALHDVDEAEGLGFRMVVGSFAEGLAEVEVGLANSQSCSIEQ